MIPPKLKVGDHIRIVAPSHSITPDFTDEMKKQGVDGLKAMGLKVSFGKYVEEVDEFGTTTVEHRLHDLHEAFADESVQAVLAATGGSSVTQLLKLVDYNLIKNNPKVFCGLSDITALAYALYAKTGIVNYYGPHYMMLGSSTIVDYSFESMKATLMGDDPIELQPSKYYNDSPDDDQKVLNEGFWAINTGKAEAKSIGGNFLTSNFVMGSEFMPDLDGSILFMEENYILDFKDVQNELQSLLNHKGSNSIKGLILGRFQRGTGMTRDLLTKIVKSKKELANIPVVGNVDFGHTAPKMTLPIGGSISMDIRDDEHIKIKVIEH